MPCLRMMVLIYFLLSIMSRKINIYYYYYYVNILYVVWTQTHREVTLRKHASLIHRSEEWLSRNVTSSQRDAIDDWFSGNIDGLGKSRTVKHELGDLSKKPYYTQYLYRSSRIPWMEGLTEGWVWTCVLLTGVEWVNGRVTGRLRQCSI